MKKILVITTSTLLVITVMLTLSGCSACVPAMDQIQSSKAETESKAQEESIPEQELSAADFLKFILQNDAATSEVSARQQLWQAGYSPAEIKEAIDSAFPKSQSEAKKEESSIIEESSKLEDAKKEDSSKSAEESKSESSQNTQTEESNQNQLASSGGSGNGSSGGSAASSGGSSTGSESQSSAVSGNQSSSSSSQQSSSSSSEQSSQGSSQASSGQSQQSSSSASESQSQSGGQSSASEGSTGGSAGSSGSQQQTESSTQESQSSTGGSSASTGSQESAPAHVHTWVDVTEIVHHDAVTEQVWVVDQPAWDETVEKTEERDVQKYECSCGQVFETEAEWGEHSDWYLYNDIENLDYHDSWTAVYVTETVVVGTETVHHDEVGHYETKTVTEAWDETVVTGQKCSECGATK